jgi:uncharacterized protein YecE (DUF72 family)
MTRFWVGTSGWHYEHWQGVFYPPHLDTRDWLSFYAKQFSTVEINNTFYRQPTPQAWESWRTAVPPGFRFAVKASRFLTHIRRLHEPAAALGHVLDGARQLGDALGPVLYQLPASFERTPTNFDRLRAFLDLLPPDVCSVIEFRHRSWLTREVFSLLQAREVAFCISDMPGQDCPFEVTASIAYVRFHGSEQLYASRYTDDELATWADRLRRLGPGIDDIFCYFNNDACGFAVANALTLQALL